MGRLSVTTRRLSVPCLWYWEIYDERGPVESGWTARWEAFESREEAQIAGDRRLAELAVEVELTRQEGLADGGSVLGRTLARAVAHA